MKLLRKLRYSILIFNNISKYWGFARCFVVPYQFQVRRQELRIFTIMKRKFKAQAKANYRPVEDQEVGQSTNVVFILALSRTCDDRRSTTSGRPAPSFIRRRWRRGTSITSWPVAESGRLLSFSSEYFPLAHDNLIHYYMAGPTLLIIERATKLRF